MAQWLLSFHIIFMVCWFAGIFYLPRIFVYYASTDDAKTRATLSTMARRLFFFVSPFAVLTLICGLLLMSTNTGYYLGSAWFMLKLLLVLLLVFYHLSCYYFLSKIMRNTNAHSSTFFRFYNELPVFLLFAIVILVIVKPWM